jgi:phage terminase large subunit GpA-like protein
MRVTSMAVDSGYHTQEVYDFCRTWAHRHVIATKGASESGKPILARPTWIDINHQGQKLKKGVQLWLIGTDTAKERLYKRLELEKPEAWAGEALPGYQHFPRGLPDEYFEQLIAEKLIRKRVKGVEKHEWVKTRERNEALDLKILCYAAFIYAGGQRVNWELLERAINPLQQDLFAAPLVMTPAAPSVTPAAVLAPAAPAVPPELVQASAPARPWIAPRSNWLHR